MKHPQTPMTAERALIRLEEQCARAEHSTGEMREKLRKWGIVGIDADKVIEKLTETRYVDDSRFAAAYVRDKVKFARWGRSKILQGLYAKRISREISKEAMSNIDETEYTDNLLHLINTKIKSAAALTESYEGRTKIYRFLVSRGYEPELCSRLLREVLSHL